MVIGQNKKIDSVQLNQELAEGSKLVVSALKKGSSV